MNSGRVFSLTVLPEGTNISTVVEKKKDTNYSNALSATHGLDDGLWGGDCEIVWSCRRVNLKGSDRWGALGGMEEERYKKGSLCPQWRSGWVAAVPNTKMLTPRKSLKLARHPQWKGHSRACSSLALYVLPNLGVCRELLSGLHLPPVISLIR